MHLLSTQTGQTMVNTATAAAPFGAGFTPEQVATADKLEMWGTGIKDAGDEYCEFRLFSNGVIVDTKKVMGY